MGNIRHFHEGKGMWYYPGIEARVTHDFTKAIEVVFQDEMERMRQVH
jgi:hypothetical protein